MLSAPAAPSLTEMEMIMNRSALLLRPWTHGVRREELLRMTLLELDRRGHQTAHKAPQSHAKDEAR